MPGPAATDTAVPHDIAAPAAGRSGRGAVGAVRAESRRAGTRRIDGIGPVCCGHAVALTGSQAFRGPSTCTILPEKDLVHA